jgi:hypothetical protein
MTIPLVRGVALATGGGSNTGGAGTQEMQSS